MTEKTDIVIRQEMTLRDFLISAVKSNLFGAKSNEQAGMQVMAGLEYGFGPVTSLSNIHIIDGKPSIGAHLLAAMIRKHPRYDYKIAKMDNLSCELVPVIDGEAQGVCSFTMEDAQTAGLVRPNSPWQKYPRNMLFARCISNLHAWYMPDAMGEAGRVYTPEELGDNDEGHSGPAIAVEAEIEPAGRAAEEGKPVEQAPAPPEMPLEEPADPTPTPPTSPSGSDGDTPPVPALDAYRRLCAGYKAHLGEDAYHAVLGPFTPDGEGKSNGIEQDKWGLALEALQANCEGLAMEGVPFPSASAFEEAQEMKRDDLLEGIGTMEGDEVANWGAYLSRPAEKALVGELRVYHAHLTDLAWGAKAKQDADDLFGEEGA